MSNTFAVGGITYIPLASNSAMSTIFRPFDGGNPYSSYGDIPALIDCGGVT